MILYFCAGWIPNPRSSEEYPVTNIQCPAASFNICASCEENMVGDDNMYVIVDSRARFHVDCFSKYMEEKLKL